MKTKIPASTPAHELQKQTEKREEERAKWDAINARARLKAQGRESVTEYGRALFERHAETVTVALGLLLEELLANPNKPGPHFAAWPLLLGVTNRGPRSLAAIALGVVIDQISQKPEQRKLAGAIGLALQSELKAGRVEKISPDLLRLIRKRRGARALSSSKLLAQLRLDASGWTPVERVEVGLLLLQVILANTDLLELETTSRNGRQRHVVRPTPAALEVVQANPPRPLPARRLPMLVPPRPWEGMHGGGHLDNKQPLVRSRAGLDLSHLDAAALTPVLAAVNTLQRQELRVDPWMVEMQRCAWDHNIRGLFPVVRDPMPDPPRPTEVIGAEAYKAWQRQRLMAQHDRCSGGRERSRIEQALRQCEEVAGLPVWFAYCTDFRGRIYTSNRYATHQGPDWEKAAVSFAHGEPCSVEAFEWLLKGAAGHYGVRGNWEGRLAWGRQHLIEMCAAAEAPLDRLELWRDAKDPWQYLQLCRAIAQQVAEPSSNCATPVRLDQTCSGIGIASALLRDRRLARLTNMTGKSHKDLYGHIAEEMQRLLRLDLSNGLEREQKQAQFWLEFGIDRSLCKGPVMTTIYGAQFLGIVDGLVAALEERQAQLHVSQWSSGYLAPARYLARKFGLLLGSELKSCLELQTWLRTVSRKVLTTGHRLQWTSPMGMPIWLGDELDPRSSVTTLTHGSRRWQTWKDEAQAGELSARSTNRAITANAIHSFDAALCQLLVSRCGEQGIGLLPNHDCFATIPARTGWLHHTLHDELRGLYATDWLAEMKAEIRSAARLKALPSPPCVGDLCHGEIGQNPHCFS
ncbi:MAG: uncultured phage MedDCM-OCT-S38-C3 [Cyanobacteriota bacterium]